MPERSESESFNEHTEQRVPELLTVKFKIRSFLLFVSFLWADSSIFVTVKRVAPLFCSSYSNTLLPPDCAELLCTTSKVGPAITKAPPAVHGR